MDEKNMLFADKGSALYGILYDHQYKISFKISTNGGATADNPMECMDTRISMDTLDSCIHCDLDTKMCTYIIL